jgi:hypothetical protein
MTMKLQAKIGIGMIAIGILLAFVLLFTYIGPILTELQYTSLGIGHGGGVIVAIAMFIPSGVLILIGWILLARNT